MENKQIIRIVSFFTILIFLIIIIYFRFFYIQKDVFEDIETYEELINVFENEEEVIKDIDDDNYSSNYSDKIYALEYLSFCSKLNDIDSIKSEKFIQLSQLQELNNYFIENNISSVEACLDEYIIKDNNVKEECIFNDDDGIHNPFFVAYYQDKISTQDFNNTMTNLARYYMNLYPSNSYLLYAIRDKNKGIFNDISYCYNTVDNNYDDFIREEEGNIHIQTGPGTEGYVETDTIIDENGIKKVYINGELSETIYPEDFSDSQTQLGTGTTQTYTTIENGIEKKYVNGELIETIEYDLSGINKE